MPAAEDSGVRHRKKGVGVAEKTGTPAVGRRPMAGVRTLERGGAASEAA
jgi:hypothetical protein